MSKAKLSSTPSPKMQILNELFSKDDPENIYHDLVQIGHGNFGAVFSAKKESTSETVAIKKISFAGKQSKEKLQEIVKEIEALHKIDHENCVKLISVHLKQSIVWVVMEFCVGSVCDLTDIINSGLNEVQVDYIIFSCLRALEYIHSKNWIHRDIKAANVLVNEDAIIKLADFGSISTKSPANTFLGSPYWMAPEVIMAMDEGSYSEKADIWSLGITAYELIDRKPPNFHLNTMSAMYHIANSDPPSIDHLKISDEMKSNIKLMLIKEPNDRISASELLKKDYFLHSYDPLIIKNLLDQCFDKAVDIDLSDEDVVNKESNLDELVNINNFLDESEVDSLSSTSLKDQNSMSSSVSTEAEHDSPPKSLPSKSLKRSMSVISRTGTLKTTMNIKKEVIAHQEMSYQQLKEYQLLRKQNMKQLKNFELKCNSKLQDHIKTFNKALESLKLSHEQALKSLKDRQDTETDKLNKINAQEEYKIFKLLRPKEKSSISNLILSAGFLAPDETKKNLKTKDTYEAKYRTSKISKGFTGVQDYANENLKQLRLCHLTSKYEMRKKFILEETDMILDYKEKRAKMIMEEIEAKNKMRKTFQQNTHDLKRSQLVKLHALEIQNQQDYMSKKENELNKKHLIETKNKPKELKVIEQQIKRVYLDSVRTQEMQYKFLLTTELEKSPKEEHQSIKEIYKQEKNQKILSLRNSMETHLATVLQDERARFGATIKKEKEDLRERLENEMKMLKNYQEAQLKHFEEGLTIEVQKLEKTLKKEYDQTIAELDENKEDDKNEKEKRLSDALRLREKESSIIVATTENRINNRVRSISTEEISKNVIESQNQAKHKISQ